VESDWGPYRQPLGERKSTGLEASHGVSCSLTREGTRIDSLSKLITGTNLHHECYTHAQSATLQRKKKWQPEWTRTPAPARSQKYLPVSAPAEKLPGDVRTALDRFIHSCLLGKSHRGPANIPSRPRRLKKNLWHQYQFHLSCPVQCASELHALIRSAWSGRVRRKTTGRSETEELIYR
jgi:hypothetical protein